MSVRFGLLTVGGANKAALSKKLQAITEASKDPLALQYILGDKGVNEPTTGFWLSGVEALTVLKNMDLRPRFRHAVREALIEKYGDPDPMTPLGKAMEDYVQAQKDANVPIEHIDLSKLDIKA